MSYLGNFTLNVTPFKQFAIMLEIVCMLDQLVECPCVATDP
jgi:hypothetical protein